MKTRVRFTSVIIAGITLINIPAGAQNTDFDRTKQPEIPAPKPLQFPTAQQRTLKNGIPVVVLEDHSSPVISVNAAFDISSALEPQGKTGISAIASAMLREGTTKRSADQLADAFAALGNPVSPTGFYTIVANADASLDLMAEQLLSPAFPAEALERIKANTVTQIRQAKESPGYMAGRVFANVVYGKDHPYSRSASEEETKSITRDDVWQYYATYMRPPNVTFVVAGAITPEQAVEKLNRVFGEWTPGQSGKFDMPAPRGVDSTTVFLYDRPESPQSVLYVGSLGPERTTPDYYAIQLMNTTLGGAFTSRINLNLREKHQYSYGAGSRFSFRRPPEVSTFAVSSSVISSKTDSSLIQVMKELRDIHGAVPISAEEFAFAKSSAVAGLPLQFETIADRAGAVVQLVVSGQPLDYYNTLVQRFNGVTVAQAQSAVKYVNPDKVAIVVVGDRKQIEEAIRAANIAPVVIVDPM